MLLTYCSYTNLRSCLVTPFILKRLNCQSAPVLKPFFVWQRHRGTFCHQCWSRGVWFLFWYQHGLHFWNRWAVSKSIFSFVKLKAIAAVFDLLSIIPVELEKSKQTSVVFRHLGTPCVFHDLQMLKGRRGLNLARSSTNNFGRVRSETALQTIHSLVQSF